MKKIISCVLACVMLLSSVMIFSVNSADYIVGDINGDGRIDARDSNCLSRFLAGTYLVKDSRSADINSDGFVNVMDSYLFLKALNGIYDIKQPTEDVPDEDIIDIFDYTVVYPEEATVYELYAAEILCDWVEDNCGGEILAVSDAVEEAELEILIGATNREESATDAVFENNQFMLKTDGNKIVMQGKDYMIGGAVGEFTYNKMNGNAILFDDIATETTVCDYTPVDGDNIILMIGDGMGYNHIAFTKFYSRRDPTFKGFIAESFPNLGDCITYCLSEPTPQFTFGKITTDSAAAATALSTGWKTQKGFLGLNGYGGEVKNIREIAYELGYKTAVVSTEGTTGATPSGFTVHTDSRANDADIIAQQAALVENGEITYLKGESYDNLLDDTKTALDLVSTDSDGFFVMIEEAYIDKACHKLGVGTYTLADLVSYVRRFNSAVEYAATFTAATPGTTLIVTADHETGSITTTGGYDATGNHSNANVPIFAMGYGTEYFNGVTVDNTDIADFMAAKFDVTNFGGSYNMKDE